MKCARVSLHRIEHLVLKPAVPSVKTMAEVVARQAVLLSVKGETAPADAVCIPADGGSEIRGILHIIRDRVESEDNIAHRIVPVGNCDRHNPSSEVCHTYLHAVIRQHK